MKKYLEHGDRESIFDYLKRGQDFRKEIETTIRILEKLSILIWIVSMLQLKSENPELAGKPVVLVEHAKIAEFSAPATMRRENECSAMPTSLL